jgi:hypothetical protein
LRGALGRLTAKLVASGDLQVNEISIIFPISLKMISQQIYEWLTHRRFAIYIDNVIKIRL